MARLGDIPRAVRKVGPFRLIYRIYQQTQEDNCFTLAAAMAYSWLFALFPFFIFLLALVPYVPAVHSEQADELINQFLTQLPPDTAAMVQSNLDDLKRNPRGGLLSLGIITTLWVASGGMAMTMTALSRCYDVDARPLYKQRPLAMLLTVAFVLLILCVVLLLPVASGVRAWIEGHPEYLTYIGGKWPLVLLDMARWMLALVLMFGALSLTYHFGPNIRQTFHLITPGAVFVVLTWLAVGRGFRWYVENFGNYNATYGAVGGVIVLLFVFYLDALLLLIGAEINSEIDLATRTAATGTHDFREMPDREERDEQQEQQAAAAG